MTRYLLGFLCLLALGVMGCSETSGTGGGGGGGSAGIGGEGGSAGMGGQGGGGGVVACVGDVCPCTEAGIRAAIAEGGGPFTFDCDGPTTITFNESLNLEKDLILDGQGNLTLDGGGWGSFEAKLELRGLAFTNLRWSITSILGPLTVIDSRIIGSEHDAIWNHSGPLTVRNTIISGAGSSGIVHTGLEPATIEYSTVTGNGLHGISNYTARIGCGPMTIRNTTASGNGGAGLSHCGEVTVANSTLSANAEGVVVGDWGCEPRLRMTNSTVSEGIRYVSACGDLYPGTVEAKGVLIEGGCRQDGEVEWSSLGYNIEVGGNTCGFDETGDQVNVSAEDLALGPLQGNGGPTETHALGEGSVAIDVIPAEECEVDEDQRGVTRPQGDACDVGSFEVQEGGR